MSDSAISGVYSNGQSSEGFFFAASGSAYQQSDDQPHAHDYARFYSSSSVDPGMKVPTAQSAFSCTSDSHIRRNLSSQSQVSDSDGEAAVAIADYIGLAEAASMSSQETSQKTLVSGVPDLNLGETELKLGLPEALPSASERLSGAPFPAERHSSESRQNDAPGQEQISCRDEGPGSGADMQILGKRPKENMAAAWQTPLGVSPWLSDIDRPRLSQRTITGAKRGYSEAMHGRFDEKRAFAESLSVPIVPPSCSVGDQDSMNIRSKWIPPVFPWGNVNQMATSWPGHLDQVKVSSHPFPSARPVQLQKNYDQSGTEAASSNPKDFKVNRDVYNRIPYNSCKEPAAEVPPARENLSKVPEIAGNDSANVHASSSPVVGWPPVQSFRNKALATQPPLNYIKKSEASPPASTSAITPTRSAPVDSSFVKVHMDGIAIGRKIDLKNCKSYDQLSLVLQEMFHLLISCDEKTQGSHRWNIHTVKANGEQIFPHGSDYVLTYEDRDGDLMLVGDVPWSMFRGTVKRLRIMKGSDAIGLAPKASEKGKTGLCQFLTPREL